MPLAETAAAPVALNPRAWLEENVEVICTVAARVARRKRLLDDERDEFLSIFWTHLTRDDCRALRAFRGASGISTYLGCVAERLLLDWRVALWGRWRPSAQARRLGPAAVLFERLMLRDGESSERAREVVFNSTGSTLPPDFEFEVTCRAPRRRPRFVELDDLPESRGLAADGDPWTSLVDGYRARRGVEIGRRMAKVIRRLPAADQVLLRMRHEQSLKVSQIATMLKVDQKKLYRRLDALHDDLRADLMRAGVSSGDVRELTHGSTNHLPHLFSLRG